MIIAFDTPTGDELADCITTGALQGLQPRVPPRSYKGRKVFIVALFVQRAVVQSGLSCPIKLIFKVREAHTELIVNLDPSLVDAIYAHVELFEQFFWGVHNRKMMTGTNSHRMPMTPN